MKQFLPDREDIGEAIGYYMILGFIGLAVVGLVLFVPTAEDVEPESNVTGNQNVTNQTLNNTGNQTVTNQSVNETVTNQSLMCGPYNTTNTTAVNATC